MFHGEGVPCIYIHSRLLRLTPGHGARPIATSPSVAEVLELQGDPEVGLLERGDDRLEVVALLAGDADLIALGLGLDRP